jgi:hypothetical protein
VVVITVLDFLACGSTSRTISPGEPLDHPFMVDIIGVIER